MQLETEVRNGVHRVGQLGQARQSRARGSQHIGRVFCKSIVQFISCHPAHSHHPTHAIIVVLYAVLITTYCIFLVMSLAHRCPVSGCSKECKTTCGLSQHVNLIHHQQSPTSSRTSPGELIGSTSTRWTHPTLTGR